MGNNRCMGNSRSVGSDSIIADIRDKAIIVIGMVVDGLDTSIRKVDRVGSLNNTIAIIGLSLVEGSSRVVISNSIVVAVGGHLSKVRGGIGGSTIGRGMGYSYRVGKGRGGMVGRGGMMNLRIGSISLVGDISNIAVVATSGVLDVLSPAVRKSNRV